MTTLTTAQQTWLNFMNAGQQHFQQGKLAGAIQAFDSATKLVPGRVEGWINLGSALQESKRFDRAADALKKAIAMNPNIMVAHLILGDALRMLGQWRDAFTSYQNAVALERTPLSLNKLACALRSQGQVEFAEGLFHEAIALDPDFTLGRVNLATLQIVRNHFDEAETQLNALSVLPLPSNERHEVESSRLALSEYRRLNEAISHLVDNQNPVPLETALRNTPKRMMQADEVMLESLQRYAESATLLDNKPETIDLELPEEWPLIEAMFMIPVVHTYKEYLDIKRKIQTGREPSRELLQSINMEAPIKAARSCQLDMPDPVKAELHLRHWHALACGGIDGTLPGHFKYTQNWVAVNPSARRVEPHLGSATLQRFISDIYCNLSPGYPRAAVVLMAIADLHLFADGNGRTALTWLNRELEWAGLMPAIFSAQLGFMGEFGRIERELRNNGSDLSPLLAVITQAQRDAKDFCSKLAQA